MSAPLWTEREDARLRSLAAGGMTGSEIARAMGRSKSGCIGRLHRLGGKLSRPSPFPARNAAKPKPSSPQVSPPPAPQESVVVTTLGQLPPAVPATVQPAALSHARTCQWVERLGYPPRFCDAPAVRGSWCAAHRARVYLPGSARVPGA